MKNLNKKIGAIALAGAIVMGGCFANVSFIHAKSSDILKVASYNSNNPEDNKIFIQEFGGWWEDYISGEKLKIKDLSAEYGIVFDNYDHLVKFLEDKKIPKGVYLASISPDLNVERENYNMLFQYKL